MEQFLGAGDAPTTTASLTDARPAAPAWAQAENSTEIQTVTPVTSGNARVASQKPDAFFLPAQPTTPASLVDTHLPEYLVANLPYNVAVPVLLHLLSALPSLRRVVVMVQREVGERLCASPGSKTYGIPSAKIAWWGQARMAGLVSRQVFWPVPHVDSVLVSLDVSQRAGLRAATFEVIDHSFAMRRKTLRANLKRWLPDSDIDAIAADAGVSLQARAESLDINDFHLLARVIARKHCDTAVAKAPGKVNLALRCGAKDARGYHPLVSVFQSVNLWETVRVTPADSWSLDMTMTDDKGQALELPQELQDMPIDTNLAVRGVKALLAYCGLPHTCAHISIDKRVPIAGGMAGGSADAAAALVAANAAFGLAVTEIELHRIARQLGADVPNALTGGNALGLGYGDHMFRLECAHTCWWVFATAHTGLSTPAVFSAYDAHTRGADAVCTSDTDRHIAADEGSGLILGNLVDCHDTDHEPFMLDSSCLPGCVALPHPALRLHNDLHETACRLRPELREVCAIATRAGALDAIVSGSGPTVACLCASESGAHDVAKTLAKTTYIAHTYVTYGPVQGAHLVETAQPPAQNTETD
ncbi:MAG: rRNA adenine N-6-methyltransferase family protein [Actinomycetaceae bacterium]|nr:rRNA adenine N-6-methyltransferase family protein [Actinomycetaceae bacterium]